MDIWGILEIAPTNNIKEIKRAYAKKLKVTRPDEHPAAFQELHFAYKQALDEATYIESEIRNSANFDIENSYGESGNQSDNDVSKASVMEAESDQIVSDDLDLLLSDRDPHDVEIGLLISKAKNVITQEAKINEIKSWSFLMDSPNLLDSRFNWLLGLEVLKLIVAYNNQGNQRLYSQIDRGVINYLNEIFNWNENKIYIYEIFSADEVSDLLDKIAVTYDDSGDNKKLNGLRGSKSIKFKKLKIGQFYNLYHATLLKRFFAFFTDVAILVGLFSLLFVTSLLDLNAVRWGYFISFTLMISAIYFFLFEFSVLQATPGKMLFGLVIANFSQNPPSFIQLLFRTCIVFLALSFSMLLIYLVVFKFMPGFMFGLGILLFRMVLFLLGNHDKQILITDSFTNTFVFDLRKTRLEYA